MVRRPERDAFVTDRWDVVVVGAGPAGATTALLLARAGASVLLVDRARFPRDKACSEYLSPATTEILERSEEHTSELQSRFDLVCRLLLENKTKTGPATQTRSDAGTSAIANRR